MQTLLILIPALPLLATLVTAALGKPLLGRQSHWPALVATALSFLLSIILLFEVRSHVNAPGTDEAVPSFGFERVYDLWTWAVIDEAYAKDTYLGAAPPTSAAWLPLDIQISLRCDTLTAIMLATVTFVSLLVVIYSIGYMHDDPGYWRYFTYVSLFVFSMTMLVSASNFFLLYVFWEAVGVCSYLLIGFWYTKPPAAAAGMKAFLVNRVGDFGFALGVFLIWITYGTLNFHDTAAADGVFGQARLTAADGFVGGGVGLAIALLLFIGACGKSAQFPLHVWLPDAMEGPTPVSALIHAATMVTAGVYMVTRCIPLFLAAPLSLDVVALIGAFTAMLAALIAITQTDLKRVLAYSTVSQLGYMFLGLGAGTLAGVKAGMFHLFTHAFFKALLFLGAGSVMHAMAGEIDMRRFSGLRRRLPVTHLTFLIGCLALAGVAPLAGFWSKDAILHAVNERMHDTSKPLDWAYFHHVLFWIAAGMVAVTAFYTFRAFWMTFYGPERIPPAAVHHAHESPAVMTRPLIVLAIASLVVGWFFYQGHRFVDFLAATPSLVYLARAPLAEHAVGAMTRGQVAVLSTALAVLGIGLASFFYLGDRTEVDWLTRALRPLYALSHGKFFFDPIYNALVVWPLKLLASLSYWIDRAIIDGLVNVCGRIPPLVGSSLRVLGNGLVPFYAMAMIFCLLVFVALLTR